MQNPYLAVIAISYLALLFILGSLLMGIPVFGGALPCADHPIPCAQTANAA